MKIIFFAPFGIRPKGTLIARMIPLASELQYLGDEVVIIAPPYTNPEDSSKEEVFKGVRIKNIALGPFPGKLSTPFLAWRMFRAAINESPDAIHLFKPKGYGGLAVMMHLFLQKLGVSLPPVYVDSDDWEGKGGMNEMHPYSALEKRFFQFQESWLLKRARGVTVASRALQILIWGMGVNPQKVSYLPNCVTIKNLGDRISIREKLSIPIDAPVVFLYTRFFEFKQEKLHYIFKEIIRSVPEVRFLVVGRGRDGEEARLLDAGKTHDFEKALFMAGWVDPEEIDDYFTAGDVALYPFDDNLINRTKCPAKLTELLAAGMPVVADSVGQIREYIRPDVSGLLCDPDNWAEMAEKTVALMNNAHKRSELGAVARLDMKERFTWQNAARGLDKFYGHKKID